MLTLDILKEWLDYDPATGLFTWTKSRLHGKVQKGRRAGCLHADGYNKIRLLGKLYRSADLAVLWMTGEMPTTTDHANRQRGDDRWENLRPCTRSQNQYNRMKQSNNKSGFKGVFWNSQRQKWQAKIGYERKQRHLGFFLSSEAAHEAYVTAAQTLHGVFTST